MADLNEARQQVWDALRFDLLRLMRHKQVVNNWLQLAQNMQSCANSINHFATLLATTTSYDAFVQNMLHLPPLNAGLAGFPPFGMPEPPRRPNGKRDESPDDADVVNGEDGEPPKKKRKRKKDRDPNAPKRPPSAYIYFQNEIRPSMKTQFPQVPYRELVGMMAAKWGAMSGGEKEKYQQEANDAMKQWRIEDAAYKGTDPLISPPLGDDGEEGLQQDDSALADLSDETNLFKHEPGLDSMRGGLNGQGPPLRF